MRYLTLEISRLLQEERKMAFIAGPRQVGKTTLAKHLLSLASNPIGYFNWDIETHRKQILKDSVGFWAKVAEPSAQRQRIVLDEIHKYPRWKRFLKGFHDANHQNLETLVTGSGRLDLYQRGGDSLFGRYTLYRLHPFTLGEFLSKNRETIQTPDQFWSRIMDHGCPEESEAALKEIEHFSGFPEPLFSGSETRLRRWRRAHHHLVIREDVRDLSRIRDIGLVEALVSLLPERIGSPLSINALSEDLQVAFNTVKGWLDTLSRLYYLLEIRPFAGKLSRTLRRESKIYLFDSTEIKEEGPRFENMVALHLRKLCDAWTDWGLGDFELSYVRDKEKREVDFLITSDRKPYALIECKLTDETVSPSLSYFHERFQPKYTIQIVRHLKPPAIRKAVSGIWVVSACQFLSWI